MVTHRNCCLIPVALPSKSEYRPKPLLTLRTMLDCSDTNDGGGITHPSMARHGPKMRCGGDSRPHPPALHPSLAPISAGHICWFPPVASHRPSRQHLLALHPPIAPASAGHIRRFPRVAFRSLPTLVSHPSQLSFCSRPSVSSVGHHCWPSLLVIAVSPLCQSSPPALSVGHRRQPSPSVIAAGHARRLPRPPGPPPL